MRRLSPTWGAAIPTPSWDGSVTVFIILSVRVLKRLWLISFAGMSMLWRRRIAFSSGMSMERTCITSGLSAMSAFSSFVQLLDVQEARVAASAIIERSLRDFIVRR